MSTRKITFILAAALSLLVIAGTKVSQLTRTRSLQETSRFLVSTQDATTGRWSSRYITAPDLATNISQWQTNITGSGGSVDPTNAVLANIISTGAVTNKPNSWLIYTGTGSTTNAYFAENRATSTFLFSNDFSGLLQNVVNRMGEGASIRVSGNPYYTNAYVFSNTVTITNFFIMEGEGNPVTVFRGASTLNGPIIQLGSQSTVGVGGIGRINRVRFEGDSMGTNGVGVDVIKCAEPVFEFCEFTGFKRAGIEMSSTNYVHWAYAQECWFVMKWASSKGILIDASPIEGADIDQNHFIVNGGLFGVFGGGAAIVQSNWFPGLTIQNAHFRYSTGAAGDVIQVYAGQDLTVQNCEFQNFGSLYPVFLADRGSTTNYNVRLIGNSIKSTALGTGPDYLAYVGTFITNITEVGNSGYLVEALGLAGDNGTIRSGVNADYITEGTLPNGRIPYALTNNYAALATFNAAVSNSSGGFWSTDVSGFISYSSPNDYMVFAHPQGGIFNTLDNWVLGDANSTKTILSLSTNTSAVESNLWVKGTNFARQVKLVGGQAASSLLRLDSNTNLAVATIGSGVSFDGTTLTGTGQGANAVLSNLVGTVANNVTNENSSALQINTGTLTLTPGILSNIVAQGFGTPYIAVNTNGGTLANITNIIFRSGVVASNDATGIVSLHISGTGSTNVVTMEIGRLNITNGIVMTGAGSAGLDLVSGTSAKTFSISVPDSLTASSTNKFDFNSPTAGQVIAVHSSSANVTVWTNAAASGGGSNFVTSSHGSAHITNQLRQGSVTYSNEWQIAQEGSRIRRQATAKEGSTTIDNHGFATVVATGTAAAVPASATNNSRVNTYSAALANSDAGHEVNSAAVRPGFDNRIHGVATIVSTTNQIRAWFALSSDSLSALTDRDMPSTKHVIGLRFNSETNSNWWFVSANGSSATNIDTGVAVQGGGYRARISMIENVTPTTTNWVAWINGLPVATNTALLPTQPMKWIGSIRTFDAAAKTNAFEYLEHTAAP